MKCCQDLHSLSTRGQVARVPFSFKLRETFFPFPDFPNSKQWWDTPILGKNNISRVLHHATQMFVSCPVREIVIVIALNNICVCNAINGQQGNQGKMNSARQQSSKCKHLSPVSRNQITGIDVDKLPSYNGIHKLE